MTEPDPNHFEMRRLESLSNTIFGVAMTLLAYDLPKAGELGFFMCFPRNSIMITLNRITFDFQIMGGRACIRGMRIPVSVIVRQIAHGASTEDVIADYPDLEAEDVQQALEYAAWLSQEI